MRKKSVKLPDYGRRLKAVRRLLGWTQEYLGELLGLSRQQICYFEHESQVVSIGYAIAIRALIDHEGTDVGNLWPTMDDFVSRKEII